VSSEAPDYFHLGKVRPQRIADWHSGRRAFDEQNVETSEAKQDEQQQHTHGRNTCEHQAAWTSSQNDPYNIVSNRPSPSPLRPHHQQHLLQLPQQTSLHLPPATRYHQQLMQASVSCPGGLNLAPIEPRQPRHQEEEQEQEHYYEESDIHHQQHEKQQHDIRNHGFRPAAIDRSSVVSDGVRAFQRELISKRSRGHLQNVFLHFTKANQNGTPFVYLEQVRLGLEHHGFTASPAIWLEIFARINGDTGDGRISLDEFVAALESSTLERPTRPLEHTSTSSGAAILAPVTGVATSNSLRDKIGLTISEFRPIFRMFDDGKGGSITLEELADGLARLRHNNDVSVEELGALIDCDDGTTGGRDKYEWLRRRRITFTELARAFGATTTATTTTTTIMVPPSSSCLGSRGSVLQERHPPWRTDADDELEEKQHQQQPPGGWYHERQAKIAQASLSNKCNIGVGFSMVSDAAKKRGLRPVQGRLPDNLMGGAGCQEMTPQPMRYGRRVVQPLLVSPDVRIGKRFDNQINWYQDHCARQHI
jgi:Ca2+-binding EF-hand superfamily protein